MEALLKKTNKTQLTDEIIKSFEVCRAFKDSSTPLNSIDWDKEGEFIITCSSDEILYLYSISSGEIHKILHSKKGIAESIRFSLQNNKLCICIGKSSTDPNISVVKNWDIFENTFTHSTPLPARAFSLSIHPHRAIMLICCLDGTVRLYSMDSSTLLVTIASNIKHPIAAFDTEGFIFGCYLGYQKLHLFDCNNYAKGEFLIFDLKPYLSENEHLTSIIFSTDGESIVVRTESGKLLRLNAITGELLNDFNFGYTSNTNNITSICHPSISPDSQYLFCGGNDKLVHVWKLSTGQPIVNLEGHAGTPSLTLFNPKKALLASACINLAWWTPTLRGTKNNIF